MKMTEIKPLKSLKEEYGDFYKKLSGLGKSIEELNVEIEGDVKTPKMFDEKDIKSIEESLSDHYLTQMNYDAADAIYAENQKKKLFEECFQLKEDILTENFDRPALWVEKVGLCEGDDNLAYEIHKMRVVKLVKDNRGDEAIVYTREKL
jgi:hypothetical protein